MRLKKLRFSKNPSGACVPYLLSNLLDADLRELYPAKEIGYDFFGICQIVHKHSDYSLRLSMMAASMMRVQYYQCQKIVGSISKEKTKDKKVAIYVLMINQESPHAIAALHLVGTDTAYIVDSMKESLKEINMKDVFFNYHVSQISVVVDNDYNPLSFPMSIMTQFFDLSEVTNQYS